MFNVCPNCGLPFRHLPMLRAWTSFHSASLPPVTLLDTTGLSIEQNVAHVAGWIRSRLEQA